MEFRDLLRLSTDLLLTDPRKKFQKVNLLPEFAIKCLLQKWELDASCGVDGNLIGGGGSGWDSLPKPQKPFKQKTIQLHN